MKSVLVIGTGRFGRYTIETLNGLGHEVLAVDRNDRFERVSALWNALLGCLSSSTNMRPD